MKYLLFALLLFAACNVLAQNQDTIFYKDGTKRACVIDYNRNGFIKYKVFENGSYSIVTVRIIFIEKYYKNFAYTDLIDKSLQNKNYTEIETINEIFTNDTTAEVKPTVILAKNPDLHIYNSGNYLIRASNNITVMLAATGIGFGIDAALFFTGNYEAVYVVGVVVGVVSLSQVIMLAINLNKAGKEQQNYYRCKLEPASSGIGIKLTF